jgi:hypothetical protein
MTQRRAMRRVQRGRAIARANPREAVRAAPVSVRCDRGRECRTGSRRPRDDSPTRTCVALRGKEGNPWPVGDLTRGQLWLPGRPIPERAAPSFDPRELTGSGAPRADDASWRVLRAGGRAFCCAKTPGRRRGAQPPRAEGDCQAEASGQDGGRPAPRPSTHRKAAGPDGFHLRVREPARCGASPNAHPGTPRPAMGARQPRPAGPTVPAPPGSSATPRRAHLPHRRPRRLLRVLRQEPP